MIQYIVTQLVFYSGLPWLIRTLYLKKRVTIIYYHNISSEQFNKHIIFLKKWFNFIKLKDFVDSPQNMPPWSLVITLDDGHRNNYNLLEVIKKNRLPVTIFLTTQIVATNRKFWFLSIDSKLKENIKKLEDTHRLISQEAQGFFELAEHEQGDGLTKEQIKEMLTHVDFQSHTATHPILPNCSEMKVEYELKQSKLDIEFLTSKPCYAIAFPNGEYTQRELQIVRKYGYTCALGCGQKSNSKNADLYMLKRISASDNSSVAELALRVTTIWDFLKGKNRLLNYK